MSGGGTTSGGAWGWDGNTAGWGGTQSGLSSGFSAEGRRDSGRPTELGTSHTGGFEGIGIVGTLAQDWRTWKAGIRQCSYTLRILEFEQKHNSAYSMWLPQWPCQIYIKNKTVGKDECAVTSTKVKHRQGNYRRLEVGEKRETFQIQPFCWKCTSKLNWQASSTYRCFHITKVLVY